MQFEASSFLDQPISAGDWRPRSEWGGAGGHFEEHEHGGAALIVDIEIEG